MIKDITINGDVVLGVSRVQIPDVYEMYDRMLAFVQQQLIINVDIVDDESAMDVIRTFHLLRADLSLIHGTNPLKDLLDPLQLATVTSREEEE